MAGLGSGINFIPSDAVPITKLNKVGYRGDLDIADGDALVVSDNTTNSFNVMTSADTFTINYVNTDDGSSSNGAHALSIQYLDGNDELQTATHVLGSSGSDTTSFSGKGINSAVVVDSGVDNFNGNNISIVDTSGTTLQAFISAEVSESKQFVTHLPVGTTTTANLLLLNAAASSASVVFKLFVYNRVSETTREAFRYLLNTDLDSGLALADPCGLEFSSRDVIWLTASTDVDNTEISAMLSLAVYDSV